MGNLRKAFATSLHCFNMTPSEMKKAASFMGHSLDVHDNYYKLPDNTYDATKIVMMLLAAEEGQLPTERGDQAKKLTEFQQEFLQRQLEDESEDEEVVTQKRQRTIFPKEMVEEISVYFDRFIYGSRPQKPTQDDIIPFLDVLKEKGIQFSGSWIKIKEKVWSMARYAQKKASQSTKQKEKSKKCSKA